MMEIREHMGRGRIEAPRWETDIVDGDAAPHIFVDLDADTLESHSQQTVCTAVVKFNGDLSAVLHLSVRVRDGKVTGYVTAGGKTRDVVKTVNVPVWKRTHVRGKVATACKGGAECKGGAA